MLINIGLSVAIAIINPTDVFTEINYIDSPLNYNLS
jgi:hypothetical protein